MSGVGKLCVGRKRLSNEVMVFHGGKLIKFSEYVASANQLGISRHSVNSASGEVGMSSLPSSSTQSTATRLTRGPTAVHDFNHVPVNEPPTESTQSTDQQEEDSAYIKRKRKMCEKWESIRHDMLKVLIADEFPATFNCVRCNEYSHEIFRCKYCGPTAYFCKGCCTDHHRITLLHQPEMWDTEKQHFVNYNLYSKWQRTDEHQCPANKSTDIIVIDDKGLQHYHTMQACNCEDLAVTLVRLGLWPASPTLPRVAFSFDFMLTLRAMVLEGQISLSSFCNAMQDTRIGHFGKASDWVQNLYKVINWECVLNFMWLMHGKNYGQCSGVDLPDGSQCLACSKEGENKRRLAMDGNFNLVHRSSAGKSIRAPLHAGRFFLQQDLVDKFVEEQACKVDETRVCNNFQAGSILRSKNKTEKLDVTGIFASICSHDMPSRALNMRFGERIAYPLYVMKNEEHVGLWLYDIGCQLDRTLKVLEEKGFWAEL